MRVCSGLLILLLHVAGGSLFAADAPLVVHSQGRQLTVTRGEVPICSYDFSGSEIPRPFFANLQLADGRRVTRNHPPRAGEDDLDHGRPGNYFHPGVWLAFSDLNGNDYWRLKAAVRHEAFAASPSTTAEGVTFTVRNSYRGQQDPALHVAEELCRYELREHSDGLLLVCDSVLRPVGNPLKFGDEEEMGFAVRVATPLAVKHGGQMFDSQGRKHPKAIWGHEARWCDCQGLLDGRRVGVMVLADPDNPYPTRWHARDYGFFAANPFGAKVFGAADPRRTIVPLGETLRLRYAVFWRAVDDEAEPAASAAEVTVLVKQLPRPQF